MIQVSHLSLSYGSRILSRDISFTALGGECLLLAGPNGSGKSTLLRTLAANEGDTGAEICGHPRPHKREGPTDGHDGLGTCSLAGMAGCGRGRSEAEAISAPVSPSLARCVLIPTGIPKVKGFTVEEFVRTGCYRESDWAGRLRTGTQQRLEAALDMLGLTPLRQRDISPLSDGEFQKACIAVGLTRRADVLLLDEPTAFLDVDSRVMVLRTLREVARKSGMAVIFSSHDLHEALQYAHRVLAFTPGGAFLESTKENRREILQAAFPMYEP